MRMHLFLRMIVWDTGELSFVTVMAWSPIDHCSSPAEAEAVGIRLAATLNTRTVLEGDCQHVGNVLTKGVRDRSQASFPLTEGRIITESIENLKILKIPRSTNRAVIYT
jgi:hypothetical protein